MDDRIFTWKQFPYFARNFMNSHYHMSYFWFLHQVPLSVTSELVAMEMTEMAQIHQHGPFSKQLSIYPSHKRNTCLSQTSLVFAFWETKTDVTCSNELGHSAVWIFIKTLVTFREGGATDTLIYIQHKSLLTTIHNSTFTTHKIINTYTMLFDPCSFLWSKKMWFIFPSYKWAQGSPKGLICLNENANTGSLTQASWVLLFNLSHLPISQGSAIFKSNS